MALRTVAAALVWIALSIPQRGSAQACAGDCDGNGAVSVDEIVTAVGVILGSVALDVCAAADAGHDGEVTVDEVVLAVGHALAGCPTPRGELVVPASEPVGVIRRIPNGPIVGGAPRMPAQYRVTRPDEVDVETFAAHLEVPWSMQFAADGRMFVTERPGRVRIVTAQGLAPMPWATPPEVRATGEGGLMGLALHPQFPDEPWVYLCYTINGNNGGSQNRISRWREVDGHGADEEILLDHFPGASNHDGCRLKFGPDGKLYATTGDAFQRSQAQDLGSLAGKVLRLNADGSIPSDNPFGASPVFTYGHRNPQGLAFQPGTNVLFETEHGPSGEVSIGAYDEVNIIRAGDNYGWPTVVGAPGVEGFHDPLLTYPDNAVPPAGATFYQSSRISAWTGNFFFTSLGARHLQRVVLDGANSVVAIERLFDGVYGRLRDVIEGPDGALYVATSNRDGRGSPAPEDDRILRLVPSGESNVKT